MKTYTISELAREFQITPRALRFYEDKDLLHPARDGLNRIYSARDRARLQLILRGKRVGFSLADIREMLDIYTLEGQRAQLKTAARRFRDQIVTLERQREDIEAAIEELRRNVLWTDEKLAEMAHGGDADASARPQEKAARVAFDDVERQPG